MRRPFPARGARAVAEARLAEQQDRFTSLLDVLGEHVYLALVLADGTIKETFQGPGADRLLGGADPDDEMANWEAALHPEDQAAYDAFNERLGAGESAEVEYRLCGADGVVRWVLDRAATRRRDDGLVEISGIVSDVTERRRMRAELDAAAAALSRVVEAMDDHLFTLRIGRGQIEVVYSGPNREALLGGEVPGDDPDGWISRIHPDDFARWRTETARMELGVPVELEYRLCGYDGVERIVHDRLRPRREPDGTLLYDGVSRDVTERRRLEDELRRSARTDLLTGAHNRGHFAELAEQRLAAAGSHGLVLLDADHFKMVNDGYGHAVGDAVLVELARRLRLAIGPGDLLGRWGGEEFVVLLAGVASLTELQHRAESLRAAVADHPIAAGGVMIAQTISLGAVRSGGTLDALVERADRCLYAAKRGGRNRVSLVVDASVGSTDAGEPEGIGMARALAYAAGLRDPEPEAHAAEVSFLATLVAERLELPEAGVWRCRLGGWLHDVGKVAIPDSIIDKPGPLDAGEWDLMRTHPAADAYSAMTSDRPYSAARSPADAADELRRSAGEQFDPAVVDALVDVLGPLAIRRGARSLRPDAA